MSCEPFEAGTAFHLHPIIPKADLLPQNLLSNSCHTELVWDLRLPLFIMPLIIIGRKLVLNARVGGLKTTRRRRQERTETLQDQQGLGRWQEQKAMPASN